MVENKWLDAQVGVLGSVLIEPSLAPRVIAETSATDYAGQYRSVFEAISGLVREAVPVDAMTVRDRLGTQYSELLLEIMKVTPTAANVDCYIKLCKEQARLSALQVLAVQLGSAVTLDDARQLLSKAQDIAVEHNNKRIFTMMEAMESFYSTHQGKKKEYIDWGISAVNDNLYAEPGDVIVLAGRPSDGKSALMLQFAYLMAEKHKVGIFSFETRQGKLTDRTVSHVTKVKFKAIKQNDMRLPDWQNITSHAPAITSKNLEFIEASGMTTNDILGITLARRYDVIFIDYLQLISPVRYRSGTRNDELSEISKALAVMARQHGVMVVELSQLKRPQKTKSGDYLPPTLTDLRESGQIEQDADAVMFLYRTEPDQAQSPRRLFIAKNKEGTLGKITLDFDGSTQTFSRPTYDEIRRLGAKGKRETMAAVNQTELEPAGDDIPFEQNELPL